MYERFYELRERPFALSPDPDYLYPSRVHREALDYLRYGLESHAGFVVITGEIGSGKTTLLQTLLRGLDAQTTVGRIVNTMLEPRELLETIMIDFGLDPAGRSKPIMLRDLAEYLVDQRLAGRLILLVIDEAQNLSLAALEELRMLSNLETEKSKLLQIVLVGQPNLRDKLAAPELEQLRQRITVSYHLSPLDAEETAKYINHRLRRASTGVPLEFPRDVTDIVHTRSRGVPRIINVICDATLVFGYAEERRQIDAALMADVLVELEATGVLPPARMGSDAARATIDDASPATVNSPLAVPVAPAILPQSTPSSVAQPDVAATYAAARALLEEAKSRAAQLDQREQMLRQRERELAEQRRVLAEEYRLLRTQRPAPPGTPVAAPRMSAPAPAFAPAGPGVAPGREGARFTPVRHETAWGRIKRLMLGNTSSALEEN
jgi:putative secretion ATPase (PEP-CTERM system associated)